MTQRIYISKLIGDGTTPETAYRPAWQDVLATPYPVRIGQAIESERHFFWVGIWDTDVAQHAALIADPRVRYAAQTLLATALSDLTAGQRNAILEVMTFLGFPTDIFSGDAKVKDVLAYIVGRALWHPIRQAEDA